MKPIHFKDAQHCLTLDNTRLSDQIARLDHQKADLFQQGKQESLARLQTMHARSGATTLGWG